MTGDDYYLFISSEDSKGFYPFNTSDFFTVNCSKEYVLSGTWKCALTEVCVTTVFETEKEPKYLCICLDICDSSYIAGQYRQILRKVPVTKLQVCKEFSQIFHIPLVKKLFSEIRVSVLNEQLKRLTLTGEISFTIHLKKHA